MATGFASNGPRPTMGDLQGKVAFVTGGGSGIGLGMARAFARAGMRVAVSDLRGDRLDAAKESVAEFADQVLAVEADVTSSASMQAAAIATEAEFGKIHVLCNNAGIGGGGPILEAPDERWETVLGVNLKGALNGIRAFLPRILEHGEPGHIVNTSSFSGLVGHHSQSAYGASKFALVGLSEFLNNDLEDTNVGVSVLCPHVVDTAIFYPDLADDDLQGIEARRETMPWLEKLAVQPDAVGDMVVKAIQEGEFYVFTDGAESRSMLEDRSQALLDAMDRQFPR